MSEIVKKQRWFWHDEDEENWLQEQSQNGYHLVKPGFISHDFEKGEPRNYVYRLDYLGSFKDKEGYLQMFADAGWEHLGTLMEWQYFRNEASAGEAPEIFTDSESKIKKYRRQEMAMLGLLPIYLIVFFDFTVDSAIDFWMNVLIMAVFTIMLAISGIFIYKIEKHIKKLKAL